MAAPSAQAGSWLTSCCLTLTALALGVAIHLRDGLYDPWAIILLNVGVLAMLGAAWFKSPPAPAWIGNRLPVVFLLAALVVQFILLFTSYPGSIWNSRAGSDKAELGTRKDQYRHLGSDAQRAQSWQRMQQLEEALVLPDFRAALSLAAACAAMSLVRWRIVAWAGFAATLACHAWLGHLVIRDNPSPHIDVFVFQQEACKALMEGKNPYAERFPNIYGPGAFVYGRDIQTADRVHFGYPYPPLSLYLALPGYLIARDVRYSHLGAVLLAGLLVALLRPPKMDEGEALLESSLEAPYDPVPKLAALLLLFTPRMFMVIEMSWTEPFVILGLAATLLAACRFPKSLPYVLGLFLATKQYLLFIIPLAALFIRPFQLWEYSKMMLKAAATVAVVSLPLVLWNLPEFWWSAVELQFHQPFRDDALSYLAFYAWNFNKATAAKLHWLAFAAVIPAIALALARFPRTPAAFAVAATLVYLVFLAVNKQAFCNYYLFVIAAACCAIALLPRVTPQR